MRSGNSGRREVSKVLQQQKTTGEQEEIGWRGREIGGRWKKRRRMMRMRKGCASISAVRINASQTICSGADAAASPTAAADRDQMHTRSLSPTILCPQSTSGFYERTRRIQHQQSHQAQQQQQQQQLLHQ